MIVKKKCQVISLKGGNIWKTLNYPEDMMTSDGEWFTNGKQVGRCINDKVHLQEYFIYITSDDEIKVGDWRMITDKESKLYGQFEKSKSSLSNDQWSKIIATTDKSLWEHDDTVPYPKTRPALPEPSEHFIKKYIEEYNRGSMITDIFVEYETKLEWCYSHSGYLIQEESEPFVKVNQASQITIHPIKESWNREEIIDLIQHAINSCTSGSGSHDQDFDEWIEENL